MKVFFLLFAITVIAINFFFGFIPGSVQAMHCALMLDHPSRSERFTVSLPGFQLAWYLGVREDCPIKNPEKYIEENGKSL